MALLHRQIADILAIVGAGDGVEFDISHRNLSDVLDVLARAKQSGVQVRLMGTKHKHSNDLLQLAAAGKGVVIFAD